MSDYITGSHPLILEAKEAAARLELRGDAPELLAKMHDMLKLHGWHGGEQLKVQELLRQEAEL
ncbi:hypothetical protein [Pseudomonas fluorescens]|uniref:hypothetical protein n=1 Tax=Pseudomonas fluorescens TaxID=294 RepID=UPI0017813F6F|nr:hypothetical protein [Pseudomonas fluorescens]